jgi:ABC-type transporter Mla subunit MlaD
MNRNSPTAIATSLQRSAESLLRIASQVPEPRRRSLLCAARTINRAAAGVQNGDLSGQAATFLRTLARERVEIEKLMRRALRSLDKGKPSKTDNRAKISPQNRS